MKKLLFILGTRPEAIKMAPLILKAREHASFDVRVCATGQHSEMLHQVLHFFRIKPDYNLEIMKPSQLLIEVAADILKPLGEVISRESPSVVFVQGDTTTAFIGALASYYQKMPVCHIEAGLRSHDKYSPFPEEMNRVLIGHIADYHFAPTLRAKENLLKEGKSSDSIYVVGNTVIDALLMTLELIKDKDEKFSSYFEYMDFRKKVILVTGHRRETFGGPFREVCLALKKVAELHDVEIIYPVHLNPNVRKPVFDILSGIDNIHLIEPLDYPSMIWLMRRCYMVLTDSGGIQEEAPSLGKPVLVMRSVTERLEGIEAGTCRLIGSNEGTIVKETTRLLNDKAFYEQMAIAVNPYGDGRSSLRILKVIEAMVESNTSAVTT
jgi:UDP-N-acetylglucosamine 2-epimerase (non-hydrolysing)